MSRRVVAALVLMSVVTACAGGSSEVTEAPTTTAAVRSTSTGPRLSTTTTMSLSQWNSRYGRAAIGAVLAGLQAVSDAQSAPAVVEACGVLEANVRDAQRTPPVPQGATDTRWRASLDLLIDAASRCGEGIEQLDVALITGANQLLAEGTAKLSTLLDEDRDPPSIPDTVVAEAKFVSAVDEQGLREGGAFELSDEDMIIGARWVCAAIPQGRAPDPAAGDRGATPAEYLISEEVLDPASAHGRRVVLAVEILCPENMPYLDQARSANPPIMPPLADFGDGHYAVNVDIAPGTYETGPVSDCYWERVDSTGEIIDNNFVNGAPRVEVTISASDAGFNSERCGLWHRIG